MPAPAHLLPILDRLGDGATVHVAQIVDNLIREALANHIPPDAADIVRDRDHIQGQIVDLTEVLMREFGGDGPLRLPDLEEAGACGVAVRVLREQAAELAALRPHVPALEAEIARLRVQLAEINAAVVELAPAPGRATPDPARPEAAEPPLTHELGGVGVVEDTDEDPDDALDWKVLEAPQVAATFDTTAVARPEPAKYVDPSNDEVRAWCAAQTPPVPCNVRGPVQRRAKDAYVLAHLPAAAPAPTEA